MTFVRCSLNNLQTRPRPSQISRLSSTTRNIRLAGLPVRICALRPRFIVDDDPLNSGTRLGKQPVSVLAQVAHQRVRVSFPLLTRNLTTLFPSRPSPSRSQARAPSFHMHPLISYDITFTPSARTVVDRTLHFPFPVVTLAQPATEPPIPANLRLVLRSPKLPWSSSSSSSIGSRQRW
jgi:hypothetical protein